MDWMARNRRLIRRVTLLTGSRIQHLALTIAVQLARTGDLVKLLDDPAAFSEAQGKSAPGNEAGAWWK